MILLPLVARNGSGTEIVSSNERYKGESEEGDSFIIANVDDEYVNTHLRQGAFTVSKHGV